LSFTSALGVSEFECGGFSGQLGAESVGPDLQHEVKRRCRLGEAPKVDLARHVRGGEQGTVVVQGYGVYPVLELAAPGLAKFLDQFAFVEVPDADHGVPPATEEVFAVGMKGEVRHARAVDGIELFALLAVLGVEEPDDTVGVLSLAHRDGFTVG